MTIILTKCGKVVLILTNVPRTYDAEDLCFDMRRVGADKVEFERDKERRVA